MTRSRQSENVEIELRIMDSTRPSTVAFADGTMTRNKQTGLEELKWFWLPRSQITWTHKTPGSKDVVVTMPEWLAIDRGLV